MRSSVAVAVGAVLGASARWCVGELLHVDGFPWATLLVNLVGCALVGWCAFGLQRGTIAWYFTVTGLLGGFTTASTFGVETRALLDAGDGWMALVYVSASVVGGLAAVATTRHWSQGVAA